uniref:SPX domain-containing protein n=1 Tax=Fusarium oxysporum (strain Fo5176) TaxID=660025 RepID=A0A0D2XRR4_FUSOF
MYTARDQATAMAIPGRKDEALSRFEDGFYMELSRQHERLHLFALSKADEISRRLECLAKNIDRWASKNQDQLADDFAIKHQRRFTKYERELKWTGSITFGTRLYKNILSDPKSFTRYDFSSLQQRYHDIICTFNAVAPALSEPSSPESPVQSYPRQSLSGSLNSANRHRSNRPQPTFEFLPPPQMEGPTKYWNEYDNGSECAGDDDEYAIYLNPDKSASFPGLDSLLGVFKGPLKKTEGLSKHDKPGERQALLGANRSPYQYSSTTLNSSESNVVAGYASSDGFPTTRYTTHYALPSLNQQQGHLHREKTLFWGTVSSFAVSFLLFLVAGTLIYTGRHKLRAEVDAGVTIGVVASLFTACSALVWTTFVTSCVLNGMLLILVVRNSP